MDRMNALTGFGVVVAVLFPLAACSSAPVKEDVEEKTVVAGATTNKYEGEPVTSSSIAIYIAEQALEARGIDYSDRNVSVSFCDGVYTITFEKPPELVLAKDYLVNIDATTGRVIEVIAGDQP
ncbi:MAG: hypothetical protein D6806_15115 [Deltaproteobacteria bacterium]|nr:MAG: hypothetical protein D6806_15115 [Deltaproteobacteria bacterium]